MSGNVWKAWVTSRKLQFNAHIANLLQIMKPLRLNGMWSHTVTQIVKEKWFLQTLW